jgi:hypothetical protein
MVSSQVSGVIAIFLPIRPANDPLTVSRRQSTPRQTPPNRQPVGQRRDPGAEVPDKP